MNNPNKEFISFNSVEYLPEINAKAVFTVDSTKVFRDESQSGNYRTSQHKYLCNLLRAVEVRCLKTTDPQSAMQFNNPLVDIVNTIRNNPEDFAEFLEQRVQSSLLELPSRDEILCNEWHASETAKSAFKPNEQCQTCLSIVMA